MCVIIYIELHLRSIMNKNIFVKVLNVKVLNIVTITFPILLLIALTIILNGYGI